LLTDIVKPADLDEMEAAALMHRRFSSITFKVVDVTDRKILFQVVQGKSFQENYQTAKRLIEIVHETFDRFLSWKTDPGGSSRL
jgi:predicted Ser/Thr protein kinase